MSQSQNVVGQLGWAKRWAFSASDVGWRRHRSRAHARPIAFARRTPWHSRASAGRKHPLSPEAACQSPLIPAGQIRWSVCTVSCGIRTTVGQRGGWSPARRHKCEGMGNAPSRSFSVDVQPNSWSLASCRHLNEMNPGPTTAYSGAPTQNQPCGQAARAVQNFHRPTWSYNLSPHYSHVVPMV